MSTQIQRRRGTTAQHASFTGAVGETTIDTDKEVVVVHDGVQVGGYPQMRENGSNSALALGSAGTPSLKFTGDTNTGIYSPGADQVAISTGGSGRLFVDSSGRVGVGTNNPEETLDANGAIVWRGSLNSGKTSAGALDRSGNELRIRAYGATAGTGQLVFRTGGGGGSVDTEAMRIDASQRVGIGTSSPSQTLHVNGPGTQYIQVSSSSNDATTLLGATSSGSFLINQSTTLPTQIWTNGSPRIHISSAGAVGIGTTTPAGELQISGSGDRSILVTGGTAGTTQIHLGDSSSATQGGISYDNSVDALYFRANGSERARIDSSGRLLVGTSSASGILTIAAQGNSSATTGPAYLQLRRGALPSSTQSLGWIQFADNSSNVGAQIYAEASQNWTSGSAHGSSLVFSTTADGASSPTERMRISSTGDIGVAKGLAIGALTGTASRIYLDGTVMTSGAGNATLKYSTSSGLVTYEASSRLVKENIEDCPYGIDAIKQLLPRKYFRTDDQQEEIGFIADEVIDVMPEFVPTGPKSLFTGNNEDDEIIPVGVNYDKLTAVLTKALQEAIAKIETLEAKVAALESA